MYRTVLHCIVRYCTMIRAADASRCLQHNSCDCLYSVRPACLFSICVTHEISHHPHPEGEPFVRNITDLTCQVGRCEGCWKERAVCSPRLHTDRLEELQRGCNVRNLNTIRLEELQRGCNVRQHKKPKSQKTPSSSDFSEFIQLKNHTQHQ